MFPHLASTVLDRNGVKCHLLQATSWRRQTPLQNNQQSAASSSKHSNYSHRPATAGGSYSSRLQQPVPTPPFEQPPAPRQPVPAAFSPVEAQANLEQRWTSVCQQGFKPAAQCKQQEQQHEPAEVADGPEHVQSSFIQTLKAATSNNSADAAWED